MSIKLFAGLFSILLLPSYSYARSVCTSAPVTKTVQQLDDKEVVRALLAKDADVAGDAVKEIARRGERMLPVLLSMEGCRKTFFGPGLGNPMSAQLIPRRAAGSLKPIPAEQAALYLIVALYRGSLGFAQSPYLVDKSLPQGERPASTSRELNRLAWASVKRWLNEYRKVGLERMREASRDPLAETHVAFW